MYTKLNYVKIKFNVNIKENVEDTMTLEISVSRVDSIQTFYMNISKV